MRENILPGGHIFVTSCVSNTPKEQVKGIVGNGYAHEPFVSRSEKSKYIGYTCFDKNGMTDLVGIEGFTNVRAILHF
jgi:hypothetical protein